MKTGKSKTMNYGAGIRENKNWILQESNFNRKDLKKIESLFCQGNGYLGQRAAMEEKYSTGNRGLYLAGTFDRFGEEEVTELPNFADFTNFQIVLDEEEFRMTEGKIILYSRELNLRDGTLTRHVYWESPNGIEAELMFERFVSMADRHALGFRIKIKPYNRNVTVRIASGIDGRVTNNGTQHFHEGGKYNPENRLMEYYTRTGESGIHVMQCFGHRLFLEEMEIRPFKRPVMERRYAGMKTEVDVPMGQTLVVDKICAVFTSRDMEAAEGEKIWETSERGRKIALRYVESGYDFLKKRNHKEWKQYWNKTDILIRSRNDYDQLAVRFALYHLNIMADRQDDRAGIGAKGLSGEGHEGHSFWDTEMFLIPFYLLTDPEEARKLLIYRGKSLPGARDKAYRNGYKGAMFPWESAGLTDGEVTPERGEADPMTGEERLILTGKKELHISADISYAVWHYYMATGDKKFMREWGEEIILATAVFWADRVEWDGSTCHIRDIIGPDEYKEKVDDNTYTNYMVKKNLELAVQIADTLEQEDPEYMDLLNNRWEIREMLPQIRKAAGAVWLPERNEDGIIPQFAGYAKLKYMDIGKYKQMGKNGAKALLEDYTVNDLRNYQVHKQADLVLLLWLFPELVTEENRQELLERNYEFYEKRTIHEAPHSYATHAQLAASLNRTEEAYELFHRCCDVDLGRGGDETLSGIHAAGMGGIWQCVVQGFCGIRIQDRGLHIQPHLPEEWEQVEFRISFGGNTLDVSVTHHSVEIINKTQRPIPIVFDGKEELLDGMQRLNLQKGQP